jgi:NADH-ubiquinone oxidoreductase chain 5
LIGFWHTRVQAGKSAVKAMIVNRVGDIGLALALSASFLTFKTLDYSTTFALVPCILDLKFTFLSFDFDRLSVISFFIF